jgi:hypothetical protein
MNWLISLQLNRLGVALIDLTSFSRYAVQMATSTLPSTPPAPGRATHHTVRCARVLTRRTLSILHAVAAACT